VGHPESPTAPRAKNKEIVRKGKNENVLFHRENQSKRPTPIKIGLLIIGVHLSLLCGLQANFLREARMVRFSGPNVSKFARMKSIVLFLKRSVISQIHKEIFASVSRIVMWIYPASPWRTEELHPEIHFTSYCLIRVLCCDDMILIS
jgi:hypothetical protein